MWKPLTFFSRWLQDTELRYNNFSKELLVTYCAVWHFQHHRRPRIHSVYQPQTSNILFQLIFR